jgi:hypothetical protein
MCLDAAFALAALLVPARQPQPGGEVFLSRPARHVRAHFADELEH